MDTLTRRHWFGVALTVAGAILVALGFSAQARPRTNLEDNIAWCVWGIGVSLSAAGVTILFARLARPATVIPIALASPFVVFVFMVILYWGAIIAGAGAWPSQAAMVRSGYQRIAEAQQIDILFGPAWYSAANFRDANTVDWITEATLAERYELLMVVPAKVDRRTGELTDVVGKPQMFLREVTSLKGRSISYGRQYEISPDDWQKVVAAGGDFSVIGIALDLNNPVPGFAQIQKLPRQGFQMVRD